MKKIISLVFLLLTFCKGNATSTFTITDTIEMRVTYNLRFVAYRGWENAPFDDKYIVEIGKHICHSYSENEYQYEKQLNENYQKIGKRGSIVDKYYAKLGEMFIGYPQDNMITVHTSMDAAGLFVHTEKDKAIRWHIINEKTIIMGYECTKALCSYAGRDYVAWFASDIPVSYGPWKFKGLPGLILRISDTKNEYVFECSSFTKCMDETFVCSNNGCKEVSKSKLKVYQSVLCKTPATFLSNYGMKLSFGGDDGDLMGKEPNPIELK